MKLGKYFKGYYYKHQKGRDVLSIIYGEASGGKFLQVITRDDSFYIPCERELDISKAGVDLDVKYEDFSLRGKVKYRRLTPLKYDIMGPFKFFPMQCSHEIVSLNHKVEGGFNLNGKYFDFTGGTGYIEGDRGTSFPKSYLWVQCGDFEKNYSIVASVADVPFGPFSFNGCVCVVSYMGREYRLATYLGARAVEVEKDKLIIKQRKYELVVRIGGSKGRKLAAPIRGEMNNAVYEDAACTANFKFYVKGRELFDITSETASFEFVV